MDNIISLKPAGLNGFLSILKKAKLLGSSLLWYNDIIAPLDKNKKIKGKHYVRNSLDDLGGQDVILVTRDIGQVIKDIEDVKGRKTSILYKSSPNHITLSINDVEILIAEPYYDDDVAIDTTLRFDDLLCGSWSSLDIPFFEDLRDNKLIVVNGESNFQFRIAKSVIPSIGVQQKAWAIKYSGKIKITSGNKSKLHNTCIYMVFEHVEVVHCYKVISYK